MSYNFIPAELSRNPPDGVSVGLGDDENIFKWELMIVGPPDTLYEGGFFAALLEFPPDFPNAPPTMTFKTPIWHPNGSQRYFNLLFNILITLGRMFLQYMKMVKCAFRSCIHPEKMPLHMWVTESVSVASRLIYVELARRKAPQSDGAQY
jgi:hypothetical protein